jgi:predicted anti-sigma-YlaC factor YlaD
MENRFENSPPEEQGWGAYATPPVYSSQRTGLCADVCKMLPDLLENDGSVRPEMAAAIYAHLAVCPGCAHEYDQMQRVIARIEALPPAEMPMDFSGLIMRRIQEQPQAAQADRAVARQTAPPSGARASVIITTRPETKQTAQQAQQTGQTATQTTASRLGSSTRATVGAQTEAQLWQRLSAGALLAGVLSFFLNSAWGRQMLGVNLANATAWMEQIAESVSRIPILGWLAGLIFSALAQASGLLSETYHNLGTLAVRGLILDIAMGVLAYYYVLTRRQREQRLGV